MIPEILVFSKRTWGTLSKEDQDLILKVAKEAQTGRAQALVRAMKESLDKMIAGRRVVNEVKDKAPCQAVVKPVWEKYGAAHAR